VRQLSAFEAQRGIFKRVAEPWSVIQSCYVAQLSDAALEWLIKAGVIKREQRVNAVEVLRCISGWIEQANA
jgi:hypothetical protein